MPPILRAMHPVTFRFRLPPVLMLRAPLGPWRRAPRGVDLDVGRGGDILVACRDGSELHARNQVLQTAAAFLRAADRNVPPMTFMATLEPGNGERPIRYAISLGARVSIARTQENPLVVGQGADLELVNRPAA